MTYDSFFEVAGVVVGGVRKPSGEIELFVEDPKGSKPMSTGLSPCASLKSTVDLRNWPHADPYGRVIIWTNPRQVVLYVPGAIWQPFVSEIC